MPLVKQNGQEKYICGGITTLLPHPFEAVICSTSEQVYEQFPKQLSENSIAEGIKNKKLSITVGQTRRKHGLG